MHLVQKNANGNVLKSLLKKHGFPETESKAFQAAVKKMYDEFEDLKMAVISPLQAKND